MHSHSVAVPVGAVDTGGAAMPTSRVSRVSPLWDQHCCLPLVCDADVGQLARYADASVEPVGAFVSVNVGYAPHSAADVRRLVAAFTGAVAADDRLCLAADVAAVATARARGQVAVAFDLEDSGLLGGDLDNLRAFYDLGVRTLVPTYNSRNAAGCGCTDARDDGLTDYGRALVREMNDVGMVVDGSHCSARTGLDLCECSRRPVIYSHSCMRGLWEHERNITDEQARACAATGGVVGITGVGVFLGPNDASLPALLRHVEYAVELLGPEHVGLASDYPFDVTDFNAELAANPHLFPDSYTRWGPIEFAPPERLLAVGDALFERGYPADAVAAICGGNFERVARQCWAS